MAKDDDYGTPGEADAPPNALAFVHDRPALVRRFLLAELLAPPLALRGRVGAGRSKAQAPETRAPEGRTPKGGGGR